MSEGFRTTEAAKQFRVQTKLFPATQKDTPHIAILHDSVQHIGLSVISRPETSSYIPTAFNMFAMLDSMCHELAQHLSSYDIFCDFFSPVLYLYYSHVVYFHILRARHFAGRPALTRSEKLILSQYERIAPAERWPIAGPLIGFIQAMGAQKPEESYHSWIVPSFPDFSPLQENQGLLGMENIPGMLRLPVIPALQKLLYNFATGAADFEHGILYPSALPLSEDNQFIGISSSATDSPSFLAVTYNLCWNTPFEADNDTGDTRTACMRRRISQWDVPDVPNDATLNTAEFFLGVGSNQSLDWMTELLRTANSMNCFFPNSTTLSKIPPFTNLGSLTHVEYRGAPPTALKDNWYYDRPDFGLSFKALSDSEDGLLNTRLGIAASTNAELPGYFPGHVTNASPNRKGPFFEEFANAEENRERNAVFLTEGSDEQDPASFYSLLVTQHFDATGSTEVDWL